MKKTTFINEIQKRLPEDIIVYDETNFDFTDDESVSILCWIKYFNYHFEKFGKKELPQILFPIISTRLRLDFGLYHIPCYLENNYGKYIVYITQNGQMINGKYKKNITLKESINTWNL